MKLRQCSTSKFHLFFTLFSLSFHDIGVPYDYRRSRAAASVYLPIDGMSLACGGLPYVE